MGGSRDTKAEVANECHQISLKKHAFEVYMNITDNINANTVLHSGQACYNSTERKNERGLTIIELVCLT